MPGSVRSVLRLWQWREGGRVHRPQRSGRRCSGQTRTMRRQATPATASDQSCQVLAGDQEATAQEKRVLRHEAKHLMMQRSGSLMDDFTNVVAGDELAHIKDEVDIDRETCEKDKQDFQDAMEKKHPGNDAAVEKEMAEYAKRQILLAKSTSDLLMRAEILINEDELGHIDALPGNIYTIAAFGDFDGTLTKERLARLLGFFLVCVIQFCGPIMILLSTVVGPPFVFEEDGLDYDWKCWGFHPEHLNASQCLGKYRENLPDEGHLSYDGMMANIPDKAFIPHSFDWQHIWITKVLGILFMAVFILNGLFVLLDESKAWKDIYNTFRFLKHNTPNFEVTGEWFLFLGAFVNSWVVMICCVDVYLVVGASRTPSDLLLDALGLLFLYNLDDIGGELDFVDDDDWPGTRLGWIYDTLVKNKDTPESLEFDEDALDMKGKFVMMAFKAQICILIAAFFAIPVLSCVTPFLVISPNS